LLVDVWEFPAIGDRNKIRVENVDLWDPALLILNQDRIDST
jgi:hypothetical protein